MGKTRDLFKKIRDTKGIFHAKMGSIKDRNRRDLTEVEDIKKRQQEYTEELYEKDFHDPDNNNGTARGLSFQIPFGASLVAQCLPAMQETRVLSLGQADPLEKEMATHSSTLAWKIPWTEEPGRLQSMGLQRVGHD